MVADDHGIKATSIAPWDGLQFGVKHLVIINNGSVAVGAAAESRAVPVTDGVPFRDIAAVENERIGRAGNFLNDLGTHVSDAADIFEVLSGAVGVAGNDPFVGRHSCVRVIRMENGDSTEDVQ